MSRHGLSLQEFIRRLQGEGLQQWQREVLEALDPDNTTHEEDPMTIETHPHTPKPGRGQDYTEQHTSQTEQRPPSMRATRYVYHVCGHAKLHFPNPPEHAHSCDSRLQEQAVPFEVVLRRPFAIDSDSAMNEVREEVREHIVTELGKQGSPYIVGDVMIRGVSHLHTVLVEAHDPGGPAVRILS